MKVILASFICALAIGCTTQGLDFPSDIHWVEKGKTSPQDVVRVLGKPNMVGNSGGRTTWTYGYYHYSLFGENHIKELKFYWDKDKNLTHYRFNSSFPSDRTSKLYFADPSDGPVEETF